MSRKKSREYAFRLVFEKFFHEQQEDLFLDEQEFNIEELDRAFVNSLIGGVNENFDAILNIIRENTVGYELDRIYKVDLAILVLAIYEIKYTQNAPHNVIINEAVELSKKYSTDKSFSFINGVLAKVIK